MDQKTLLSKSMKIYHKLVNRETIAYVIAGVLTTIVNFASYEGLYRLGVPNLTANAIAWVIAVVFAYVVNRNNVFQSKSSSVKEEAAKIMKFFGARLATFVVEEGGMFLFIDVLGFYRLFVKAALAVVVILLNYIFSKLYIFNKRQ
jgi:putative flippase GtrA